MAGVRGRVPGRYAHPPAVRPDSKFLFDYVTIRQRYAHLEGEFRKAFEGQEDVEVIVDRRCGERRMSQQPVPAECRRGDRRRLKEELVEVVVMG